MGVAIWTEHEGKEGGSRSRLGHTCLFFLQ